MGEQTGISWTDHSFNPWSGCVEVSPGCMNCYAREIAERFPKLNGTWGKDGVRRVPGDDYWEKPKAWNRKAAKAGERRRVFCASMADVFEDRPDLIEPRNRLFKLVESTPNLDWLMLTKRPENVLRTTYDAWCKPVPGHVSQNHGDGRSWKWPSNVWLGTTAENQEQADIRIPILLSIPAAVRFLSVEPMLGPIDFRKVPGLNRIGLNLSSLWVIAGGESGAKARPFSPLWARQVRDQCKSAGVPFFMKQLGSNSRVPAMASFDDSLRIKHPHGADPAEWPEDLRVQEFPK